jgi:cytoskeletal protein CcmA (bactofilin family)
MTHFDEMTCLLYIDGQLDAARAREIDAHLSECASCRGLLRALQQEGAMLSSALTEDTEAMPARLLGERARAIPSWIWTLAFGVVAACAYFLWIDAVGPWIGQMSNAGFGGMDLFSLAFFSGALWEGWSDMIDAMQIGAAVLAALIAIGWIARRLRRRTAAVAVIMPALLFALALPQKASAADVRRGRAVTIPAGEVVHNDLIAAGPSVRIEGTIEGDLIVATRDLNVSGHVTGDVIGFSGVTVIDGVVDGNVRVFTRNLVLQGKVGKNVSAFANSVDLGSSGNVSGGAIVFASDADLDGKIQRDLLGVIARSDLEGLIGGETWIRGGSLTVASSADLRGPATFAGPQPPTVESGAKLASPIRTEMTQEIRRNRRSSARVGLRAISAYGGALLVGILLLLILPGFFRAVVRETGIIGVGALVLIAGIFLAAVGILFLFIGTGAGVAAAMAYAPIIYVAQVFVGAWLGNKILGEPANTSAAVGRIALGLLILHVLELIPVLGGLVWLVVAMWGVGAVLVAFYRMSRVEAAPSVPVPA